MGCIPMFSTNHQYFRGVGKCEVIDKSLVRLAAKLHETDNAA